MTAIPRFEGSFFASFSTFGASHPWSGTGSLKSSLAGSYLWGGLFRFLRLVQAAGMGGSILGFGLVTCCLKPLCA